MSVGDQKTKEHEELKSEVALLLQHLDHPVKNTLGERIIDSIERSKCHVDVTETDYVIVNELRSLLNSVSISDADKQHIDDFINLKILKIRRINPEQMNMIRAQISDQMEYFLEYAKHNTWFGVFKHSRIGYKWKSNNEIVSDFNLVVDSHVGECKASYKLRHYRTGTITYNSKSKHPYFINFCSFGDKMGPEDESFLAQLGWLSYELRDKATGQIRKTRCIAAFRKFEIAFMNVFFNRVSSMIIGALLFASGAIYASWDNKNHSTLSPIIIKNICINNPECGWREEAHSSVLNISFEEMVHDIQEGNDRK